MKIEDIGVFGLTVKALLDANASAVKAYNTELEGTWEVDVFDVQLEAVLAIIGTHSMIKLNEGETIVRNGHMEDERSILTDLEFKIERCIADGTITDSLGSFGLKAFRDSINVHDIGAFHLAYEETIGRLGVVSIAEALDARGFSGADIVSITTAHDLAWGMNATKISLKTSISSLSVANQAVVKTFLRTCQLVIDSIHAYAGTTGNVDLGKRSTKVALLKTVVHTVRKVPRKRHIAENTSICFKEHPVARDLMEFTLLTKNVEVYLCRMDTKTGTCSGGIKLVYNEILRIKKRDVPGTGDCIIITNGSGKKVVVLAYTVKG